MTKDVAHLFMCLFAIYRYSLIKMSIPIFCPCLLGCLLLLNFESSLYILDVSLLSDTGFVRIITSLWLCLFTLLLHGHSPSCSD